MRYAENTEVSVARSKAEIEETITRFGADQFASGFDAKMANAVVQFGIKGRVIRFILPLPGDDDPAVKFKVSPYSHKRVERSLEEIPAAREKASRQKWRALAIAIKAKLAAVEAEITTFDEEFLAHIVVPGTNQTVGKHILPESAQLMDRHGPPPSLLTFQGNG